MFSVPEHIQWSIRRDQPRVELTNASENASKNDDQVKGSDEGSQLKRITILSGNQPKKLTMGVPLRARGLTENDKGLFQFNSNKAKENL